MHPNQFFALIFLLFIGSSASSQEISISNEMAESEYKVIGFWKNKLLSYGANQALELRIVDTTSEDQKAKTFKLNPKADGSVRTAVINCFIHADFLYEVYYVFTHLGVEGARGYNMIVKRDLNTMEVSGQHLLEQLDTQVKFVKMTPDGFYICFGYSYSHGGLNYLTRSNYSEVIPTLIKGFDYELDPLMELNLKEYEIRLDPYLNELSFDEHDNLLIPIAQREFLDEKNEEVDEGVGKIIFLFTNLSGDLIKTKLSYDLGEKVSLSSVKIRFDEQTKKHKGIIIVNSYGETRDDSELSFGYLYLEWSESGELLRSKFVSLPREVVVTPELKAYAESVKMELSGTLAINLESNHAFFGFLEDGSAVYAVSNISTPDFRAITNSKFILCISREGNVKWALTLPYSHNSLYDRAYFFLEKDQLHIYTREFTNNFSTGSYHYQDSKVAADGESVVMTDRVIDLSSGAIISHRPIIEQRFKKFEPSWPIQHTAAHEYFIRYRNPKGNKDRWVKVRY